MSDTRPPPWLPDWRDARGYPDAEAPVGTSSSHRWRWEFQRRDPDYQRAWAERANLPAGFWREQYGLIEPVDPATPRARFEGPLYWIQPLGAGERKFAIIQGSGTALIQFDLARPLRPQFERAEFTLQPWTLTEADLTQAQVSQGFIIHRRRKAPQWRPRDWLLYLRLLDANVCRVSNNEIAAVLYPKMANKYPERARDARLRDDRKAAEKLLKGRRYTLL